MNCNHCSSKSLIRKGKIGIKQRYQCKCCGKYQQDIYSYEMYKPQDDIRIKKYNVEGLEIRSMSRILGYSRGTIIRRIMHLASNVTKPIYCENNQIYEVDEMWIYVGQNHPSCYSWITYAINRKTYSIIDVAFGGRTKMNLNKVISSVKMLNPKKIVTDKLIIYPNLVKPVDHDTNRYSNNHIERGNLTL